MNEKEFYEMHCEVRVLLHKKSLTMTEIFLVCDELYHDKRLSTPECRRAIACVLALLINSHFRKNGKNLDPEKIAVLAYEALEFEPTKGGDNN